MYVLEKITVAVFLFMALASISHRGVSAQGSQCGSKLDDCKTNLFGSLFKGCSDHKKCVAKALTDCNATQDDRKVGKQILDKQGCYCSTSSCKLLAISYLGIKNCREMQRCVKEELTDCVANDDDRSKANKELDDEGCSGSSLPFISGMCLLIVTLLHTM